MRAARACASTSCCRASARRRFSMSDDGLFTAAFSSEALRGAFSGAGWLKALLDFEIALARVQERAGKIPRGVADAIASLRGSERLDPRALARDAVAAGNP